MIFWLAIDCTAGSRERREGEQQTKKCAVCRRLSTRTCMEDNLYVSYQHQTSQNNQEKTQLDMN